MKDSKHSQAEGQDQALEQTEEKLKVVTNWSVYLIRTAANQLYCGVTTDVERRFKEHQGTNKGAKYLKGKGPLLLAWFEQVGCKRTAMQLEYRIKRLPKAQKEKIVAGKFAVLSLLE
ncbi:hypothetical protein C9I98_10860 [Photobacterium sanctipauli]|uniref:GIY-YIG domain-containing protein n=1 Tax=Photobacterium sanctipauli TaxID=1342794 RepID=A0A2T3NUL0_9GAMM|nr:GIY-YIG nuclease family protein [Photobacterium sanctipauli]PSW19947.1 hypothetical protein C9I98_10860 [Photobacterium sanctipauli]